MKLFLLIVTCLVLCLGCSKSEKDKFIYYKENIPYSIREDIYFIEKVNSKLATHFDSCNVEIIPVVQLTDNFFDYIQEIKDDFINKNGGLQDDATLTSEGDIAVGDKYFIQDKNGQRLIDELQKLKDQLKPHDFNLDIKHSYYEKVWSKEFTFDEYLFQHEPPEVIFETLDRLKLRIQLELNSYLIDQLSKCN